MDIWVWYCRFVDCGRGVHNVMGNWHVWQSLFLGSREADLSTINLMAFSAVNNTSSGSPADVIQQAINDAAKLSGQRPVVHLPMGHYNIGRTITVPPDCDVQLIGDSAGETGTRLQWTGPEDGVVLLLKGPSRATLRD